MNEKRKEFRIIFRKKVDIEELIIYDQYIKLPKPLNVEIINISSSGLLMATILDIPDGTCFCIQLQLDKDIINIIIETIRKEYSKKSNKWNYGCKFIHLGDKISQKIRKFIFKEQIEINELQRK